MKNSPEIIVSLTSFPAAMTYAADAVHSILTGSLLPDRIVLYLDRPEFPGEVLPAELSALRDADPRFEVRFYDGYIRSYTKLVPALADFPDDVIVTVDDDILYDRNMLRDLVRMHRRIPNVIFAHRARHVKLGEPYKQWKKYRWYNFLFKRLHFDHAIMQTGVGGVLYPPRSLDMTMIDPKLFTELAPTTDDVWFWAAAVSKGTYVVPVPFGMHNKPRGQEKPRELSLKTFNVKSGIDRNREALERILEKYPLIEQRLKNEK